MRFLLAVLLFLSMQAALPAQDVVDKLNERNKSIKSFYADIHTTSKIRALTFSADGMIAYEKPLNFHILNKSTLRKNEVTFDMGSNKDLFWVWSSKLKPPTLYWAKYEDYGHIRQLNTMNPLWMMDALGLNEISIKDANHYKSGDVYYVVIHIGQDPGGAKMARMVVLDLKTSFIKGVRFYNSKELVVLESITEEYYPNGLPKKMTIRWEPENLIIHCTLENPRLNPTIPESYWRMPKYDRVENLGASVSKERN